MLRFWDQISSFFHEIFLNRENRNPLFHYLNRDGKLIPLWGITKLDYKLQNLLYYKKVRR